MGNVVEMAVEAVSIAYWIAAGRLLGQWCRQCGKVNDRHVAATLLTHPKL